MICLGYKKFNNKEGIERYVINIAYPFRNNEGVGQEVYNQFVDKIVFDQLDPKFINQEIEFDEHREGRYSRITGVSVVVNGRSK